jgi:hypothetical protein
MSVHPKLVPKWLARGYGLVLVAAEEVVSAAVVAGGSAGVEVAVAVARSGTNGGLASFA